MDMPVKPWLFQPGLLDQEGLLPAPLVQTGEELGAWCCGAMPASRLSAEDAGVGAFPNFRGRTEGLQGGPGQEEIISFHTSGFAIGVEKLNVWKSWKNHCLEDLEESLSPLQYPASIPVHCIQLYLSLFWNSQSSQFLLNTPGPV